MKNCTCGVKFTGGLHSNWCDTLAPDEPEPDTLPSPYVDIALPMSFAQRLATLKAAQQPAKPAPKAHLYYVVAVYGNGDHEISDSPVSPGLLIVPAQALLYPDGRCAQRYSCGDAVVLAPPQP